MDRAVLTAMEVAEIFGIAQSTVHQQAREGSLPSFKCGDRTLFPARAIKHLADFGNLPTGNATGTDEAATRIVLELERKTCEARLAAIIGLLAEIDGSNDALVVRPRRRAGGERI